MKLFIFIKKEATPNLFCQCDKLKNECDYYEMFGLFKLYFTYPLLQCAKRCPDMRAIVFNY